jgi:hypothetical protein
MVGILCVFLSANWLSTIVLSWLNYFLAVGGKSNAEIDYPDIPNILLKFCMDGKQYYAANVIFICMAVYMFAVVMKGNTTIGFRFASPTFYPMRTNETLLSSFLFNIAICNACNLGIVMYCVNTFKIYTQKSYIYKFTQTFVYSNFMFYLYVDGLVG